MLIPYSKSENGLITVRNMQVAQLSQNDGKDKDYKLKFNETCSLISSCIDCEYSKVLEKNECLKTGLINVYNCNSLIVFEECEHSWKINRFILFTILMWLILTWVLKRFIIFRKRLEMEMIKRIIGEQNNLKSN